MFAPCRTNLVFINQLGPCRFHSWRPTNQNLNKCLMKVKELAKLTHYFGFHIQRLPDREVIYNHYGGPNKGRHYLRQSKSQKQYEHHNTRHDKVMHMYHQRFKSPHNTITGVTLWIWTSQWGVSEPNLVYNQMGPQLNGDRNSTNRVMESWGMKTVNIDDRTAPRVENLIPHRHKLYQQNFPWLKEPVTNHKVGDADFGWKGEEKIDYGNVPAAASFDHSIMMNSEAAVAAARGQYVPSSAAPTPSKNNNNAAKAAANTSSSATTATPVAAEPKATEKKAAAAPTPTAAAAATTETADKKSEKKTKSKKSSDAADE